MWAHNKIGEYEYWVKHYNHIGSEYGINQGAVSKLEIRKGRTWLYQYDRGLCFDRLDAEGREVYEQILKKYN